MKLVLVNLIEMKFMKKLIDTCILIYLIDASDKIKHKKVLTWFEKVLDSNEYYISIQNIREFVFVSKKKSLLKENKIIEYVNLFLDAFNVVYDNIDDIKVAATSSKLTYWDSLLIATAKRNNIIEIITENEKDFDGKIKVANVLK